MMRFMIGNKERTRRGRVLVLVRMNDEGEEVDEGNLMAISSSRKLGSETHLKAMHHIIKVKSPNVRLLKVFAGWVMKAQRFSSHHCKFGFPHLWA